MKKVIILSLIAFVAIVISSCGSSNNVVSNNGISKRKYNKGFFFNRKANFKTANTKVKEAELKDDKATAKVEKVEAKKIKKANNIVSSTIEAPKVTAVELELEEGNFELIEETSETKKVLKTNVDGIETTVTEHEHDVPTTEESIQESTKADKNSSSNNSSSKGGGVHVVILVILALIIPPLAVFLFEGVTGRFWIDLILALVGIGLGLGLGGIAYLAALAAVIYALLIVLNVI